MNKKKAFVILLFFLLLVVFVVSSWKVVDILGEYRKGKQSYEDLEQYVSVPETLPQDSAGEEKPNEPSEETQPEKEYIFPVVDFDALKAINDDVVGWLYIPDTNVNYPVVQGKDNDQYLYRLMTGEYNIAGTLFLEAGVPSDFSGRNSTIYGHNMKSGTMFAQVVGYKKQEFFDTHPVAMLMTPQRNYCVHIFSGYVTHSQSDAWCTEFTDSEFEDWLIAAKRKSHFSSDVTPSLQDHVLTFSTCSYEFNNARFVVHGILEPVD